MNTERQVELMQEARGLIDQAQESGEYDLYLEAQGKLREVFETLRYAAEGEQMVAGYILLGLLYAGMEDRYTGLGFDPAKWAVMGNRAPVDDGDPVSQAEGGEAPELPWTPADMAVECFEFVAGNLSVVPEEQRYLYHFLLAVGYDQLRLMASTGTDQMSKQAFYDKEIYFLNKVEQSGKIDSGPGGGAQMLNLRQMSSSGLISVEERSSLYDLLVLTISNGETGVFSEWIDRQLTEALLQ